MHQQHIEPSPTNFLDDRELCTGQGPFPAQEFMRVTLQERSIPTNRSPKAFIVIFVHPDSSSKQHGEIDIVYIRKLAVYGREILDRVTDENSQPDFLRGTSRLHGLTVGWRWPA